MGNQACPYDKHLCAHTMWRENHAGATNDNINEMERNESVKVYAFNLKQSLPLCFEHESKEAMKRQKFKKLSGFDVKNTKVA